MPKSKGIHLNWKLPIAYASGEGNYTTLHYPGGQTVLISYTLKAIEKRFGLLRIHKQVAVNPDYITSVIRYDAKQMAVHIGAKTFAVAKRRVQHVSQLLTNARPGE